MKFNNEQLRLSANLQTAYDGWIAAHRDAADLPNRLSWKTVSGRDYLYSIRDGRGNGSSLGPRSPETEALFVRYAAFKTIVERSSVVLAQQFALWRALRLPLLSSTAGAVLRALDQRRLLGVDGVLVVGTNTMAAYEMAAAERFATGLDATEDFDLAWAWEGSTALSAGPSRNDELMAAFKAVDSSFTVNLEKPHQARNAAQYEIELLLAPSRTASYPPAASLRPVANLPEQEWLLLGRPVDEVIFDLSGLPCRIVAPDPRWMALHKLWLADKPERNPKKIAKDRAQGLALLDVLPRALPQFPVDAAFRDTVPAELRAYLPA